ncbi:MAG: hypothetical protein ACP5QT_08880 [Brevinematia bacterium]
MWGFDGRDYHFSISEREEFYKRIINRLPDKYVLLKTCDRVELYYDNHKDSYENDFNIAFHLFSLASGIKSPLIGEVYILHQIKKAYEEALFNKTTSRNLNLLFQKAFNAGKKIRNETKISEGAPSHSLAAYKIIKNNFSILKDLNITIIGVNKISEDLLKYFKKCGVRQIYLGNRTYEKALEISRKYEASVFKLDELRNVLSHTDVLISATSAPHIIVKQVDIPLDKDILIIDLAVPNDVESSVKELRNVKYYDVHETERLIISSMEKREEERKKAEKLAFIETEKFLISILRNNKLCRDLV